MTTKLSVGSPYHPGVSRYPECSQYNYRAGAHELLLFFSSPSKAEVLATSKGRAQFALFVAQPVIILAHRFGADIPWGDSPFSWHLVPEQERDLPSADIEQTLGANLHIVLVDAATGIVRALRMITLSNDFTRHLHAAIREQAELPFEGYDSALQGVYARYPTTTALVNASAARFSGKDRT